ncbi:MAG: tripartite tricarboxylate transporter substrate binding protein [Pseudomonadota bacterium]|jgi:tripartite-type tricarboxylate transporter receptor subunit TctC
MSLTLHLKANATKLCKRTAPMLLLALLSFGAAAQAQTYANKKISFMVPWPAGGATDVVARVLSSELQTSLGQPVIVENIVGAGGSIGTTKALKAPADGHTLLVSTQQDLVLSPFSYKSANYKHEEAQTVALVGYTSVMVVVRNSLPAQTFPELVALMKASTDKPLSYCTPGAGTIYPLIMDRINNQLQTKSLQVPYPGFGPCLTDLVGGRIDFALLPIAGPFPDYIESGKIRGLALLSDKPNARFPKVPLASSFKGLENTNFSLWSAVHVSSAVPAPIVEQLNKAVLAALAKPEVRKTIEATGASVFEPTTVKQAHAFYLDDVKVLGSLAKASGFVPQ